MKPNFTMAFLRACEMGFHIMLYNYIRPHLPDMKVMGTYLMKANHSLSSLTHPLYASIGASLLKTPRTSTTRGFKHRKYATMACGHNPR